MKPTNNSNAELFNGPLLLGVIGGTPFDAYLGKTLLQKHGINSIETYLSDDPLDQTKLQSCSKRATEITQEKIAYLRLLGCQYIFIYCNSLSSVIDLNYLKTAEQIPIMTPFDVYYDLIAHSTSIGVMTANQHSLNKFREMVQSIDKQKRFMGQSFLPMVSAIEKNMPVSEIIDTFHLLQFCQKLDESDIQVLILGCTHFSIIYAALAALISANNLAIKVFDPSTCMVNSLLSKVNITVNRQTAHP